MIKNVKNNYMHFLKMLILGDNIIDYNGKKGNLLDYFSNLK